MSALDRWFVRFMLVWIFAVVAILVIGIATHWWPMSQPPHHPGWLLLLNLVSLVYFATEDRRLNRRTP